MTAGRGSVAAGSAAFEYRQLPSLLVNQNLRVQHYDDVVSGF
jgi:hypothetical protein